ncbi:MAG TPA: hypothetical protein VLC46_22970, partial [Thermoanaerobaculia bacterium]|nr:hypothetical protein [Thermoanaerobaculia bacterium]
MKSQAQCSLRVLLPTAFFSEGEKVPKADEGALALAEQWTIFMNGRVETIENSQLRREDRPLIRLSAPSPPQET